MRLYPERKELLGATALTGANAVTNTDAFLYSDNLLGAWFVDFILAVGTITGGGDLAVAPLNFSVQFNDGDAASGEAATGYTTTNILSHGDIFFLGMGRFPFGASSSRKVTAAYIMNSAAVPFPMPMTVGRIGIKVKKDAGASNTINIRKIEVIAWKPSI